MPRSSPIDKDTIIGHVVFYAGERYLKDLAEAPRKGGVSALTGLLAVLAIGFGIPGVIAMATGELGLLGIGAIVLAVGLAGGALASLRPSPRIDEERVKELEALDEEIKAACDKLDVRCYGCDAAPVETLEKGAELHGFDLDDAIEAFRKLDLDLSIYDEDGDET